MTTAAQVVIDRVRVITGDKFSAQFTDADIIRWINDAQQNHATSVEWGKKDVALVSTRGQYSVAVGTPYILVHDVYYDGTQLTAMSVDEMNDLDPYRTTSPSTALGVPQYYWLFTDGSGNACVGLYPTPDTSGKSIVVTMLQSPTDVVAGGDALAVPDEFVETLVRYCLQMAAEWGEDWQAASWFKKDVSERTGDDRYVHATRAGNSYPVIRNSPGENW